MRRAWGALGRHARDVVPPGPEGLVWWLTLLASVGVTAVIPLLPLYAEESGADLHAIGLMAAAYLVTNLLFLYAAGRLSDRVGRRPLMGVGLVTYALCSLGFVLWTTPTGFITLRALEGVAAACFLPAALAYVADRYPGSERGLRISQLAMAENLGLLLGPAFGGAVKTFFGMPALFVLLTAMCVVGALLVARLPHVALVEEVVAAPAAGGRGPMARLQEALAPWRATRRVLLAGVWARATAGGFAFGLYLTAWPLFMRTLGASDWDVSLSWTMFAVPALVFGPFAGRLIDSRGPERLTVWGAAFSAVVVGSYAFAGSVAALLALCMLEGIGFAFSYPAQNTLVVQCAPEALRGRVIGLITGGRTLGTLVGALATPTLYGMSPLHAFGATSVVCLLGAALLGLALAVERRSRTAAA
ncbi:MAG: MFS transporter [Candidatus Sericytochromatia bacterium]|nr:MFS transporter [Candidatus Sericytochromatia bacterium]